MYFLGLLFLSGILCSEANANFSTDVVDVRGWIGRWKQNCAADLISSITVPNVKACEMYLKSCAHCCLSGYDPMKRECHLLTASPMEVLKTPSSHGTHGCSTFCGAYAPLAAEWAQCPFRNDTANGNVTVAGGATSQQTAYYTCDVGYNLVGNSDITCLSNGSWSETPRCQLWPVISVSGFKWHPFWWYNTTTWPANVTDVLQSPFGSCHWSTDSYCFGRLPSHLVENSTESLAIDDEGNQYTWAFDSSNPVAHQAWLAFHDHTKGSYKGSTFSWQPTKVAGRINSTYVMKAFKYGLMESDYTINSIILDDNHRWCKTTIIEIGESQKKIGVDHLYDTWCDKVSPTNQLALYYKL